MRTVDFGVARNKRGEYEAYLVVADLMGHGAIELVEYLDVEGLQKLIDGLTAIKHEIDNLNNPADEPVVVVTGSSPEAE